MATTQETFILNEYADGDASLRQRTRTSARGKQSKRYTIDIKAEPLAVMLDEVALGAGPAEAIRGEIEEAIKQISQPASPSTILRRSQYALDGHSPSYRKRYAGGRIGEKRPGGAARDTLFNDSGRLAEGLAVRQNPRERSFTINVPANRLTERRLAEQLFDLVPELSQPAILATSPDVREAIERAQKQFIAKAKNVHDLRRVRLRQQQLAAAKALFGLVRSVGGL